MNQEQLWEIEKYVTQEGICPFDEWFETLDSQFDAKPYQEKEVKEAIKLIKQQSGEDK